MNNTAAITIQIGIVTRPNGPATPIELLLVLPPEVATERLPVLLKATGQL